MWGEFRQGSGMGWEEGEREKDWGSGLERYWGNWGSGEGKNYLFIFYFFNKDIYNCSALDNFWELRCGKGASISLRCEVISK